MKQVNWGIIGLGNIALKFADGFNNVKNAKLLGIASKNLNKLESFKKKFQISKEYCFNNYEELLKCKSIDIIYIALPNSLHYEWIIKSIKNEKNILVEKPATINFTEIKNIKNLLENKQIFFAEAFMYLYHPQILKTINLIKENIIGRPISMKSFFGIDILTKKNIFGLKKKKKINYQNRLFNKELGGGAILDLGCYPLSFSTLIAKLDTNFSYSNIDFLQKKINTCENGIDLDSYAKINFKNNFKSYIGASFTKNLGKRTIIEGSKAKLIIEDTWQAEQSLIKILGDENKEILVDSKKNIYSYEIETLSKNLIEDKKYPDFPGFSIIDTFENMKILDKWIN